MPLMSSMRIEARALQYVLQFLDDCGYDKALRTLEEESFIKYEPGKMGEDALVRLIGNHEPLLEADSAVSTENAVEVVQLKETEKVTVLATHAHHQKNALCVRFSPHAPLLASTSSDLSLALIPTDGNGAGSGGGGGGVRCLTGLFKAGIISMDWHPLAEWGHLLLTGCMNSSHAIVDTRGEKGRVVQTFKDHMKYVNRCCWSPAGTTFVTASYDGFLHVYALVVAGEGEGEGEGEGGDTAAGAAGSASEEGEQHGGKGGLLWQLQAQGEQERRDGLAEPESPADPEDPNPPPRFRLAHKVHVGNAVECVSYLDDATVVMGVRESNYLRYMDINTLEVTKVNMNANRDDYLSFNPMDVSAAAVSGPAAGQAAGFGHGLVAVSTDRNRLICFDPRSPVQACNLYGLDAEDDYSQPRHAWHPSGVFIFAKLQNASVHVFDIRTSKMADDLKQGGGTAGGHTGAVRDLHHHHSKGVLATASFDKTVKLWSTEGLSAYT